jgi:hypothetical protein
MSYIPIERLTHIPCLHLYTYISHIYHIFITYLSHIQYHCVLYVYPVLLSTLHLIDLSLSHIQYHCTQTYSMLTPIHIFITYSISMCSVHVSSITVHPSPCSPDWPVFITYSISLYADLLLAYTYIYHIFITDSISLYSVHVSNITVNPSPDWPICPIVEYHFALYDLLEVDTNWAQPFSWQFIIAQNLWRQTSCMVLRLTTSCTCDPILRYRVCIFNLKAGPTESFQ